jgi:hypothetical protein
LVRQGVVQWALCCPQFIKINQNRQYVVADGCPRPKSTRRHPPSTRKVRISSYHHVFGWWRHVDAGGDCGMRKWRKLSGQARTVGPPARLE